VRVFNWFQPEWPEALVEQLNPDVSVRDKGVMEKCTFCVQRIRRAKDLAKDEDREVADGDITPACAQACPTDAIVFGDLNDPTSRASIAARSDRGERLLEELGTEPAVTYLRSVHWGAHSR
jgi:molybdopterin-containing oxidoreductase family iron-sulfur binding subunit